MRFWADRTLNLFFRYLEKIFLTYDPLMGKLQMKGCTRHLSREISPASGMTERKKIHALAREASFLIQPITPLSRDYMATRRLETTKFSQAGRSGTLCTHDTLSNIGWMIKSTTGSLRSITASFYMNLVLVTYGVGSHRGQSKPEQKMPKPLWQS